MSNKLKKIEENANKFDFNKMVKELTPEQYMKNIAYVREQERKKYYDCLIEIEDRYKKANYDNILNTVNVMSVEILYEVATKLGMFNEDCEAMEQKIDLIQEIYENTMRSVEKYAKCKTDNQAQRSFNEKIKKMKKLGFEA